MFDRRFDESDETDSAANENLPNQSVDGIPSIAQLLDSINEQKALFSEKTEEISEAAENNPANADFTAGTEENTLPNPVEASEDYVEASSSAAEAEIVEEASFPFISQLPSFSADQVKEAEEKAREEGRISGLEEGRSKGLAEGRIKGLEEGHETAWQEAMVSIEKQNSDTLSSIDDSLKNILETLERQSQKAFCSAIEFSMAVCRKALPSLCEKNAVNEIRNLLEKNLCFLKDEPKISLRLNPFLADKVKPVLSELLRKETYHGKVSIVRDDSLPVGDCLVEWKNGGLEKRIQDVLNHTEELVKSYTLTESADESTADHTGEINHG